MQKRGSCVLVSITKMVAKTAFTRPHLLQNGKKNAIINSR